ncbi:MAG: PAS domain-containing sensor histidine kinase [Crocinitomicaceae bacterium]|nr:PAS domain-containing sensor histidine kinase [Crocinitomicaceae bacterium]
MKISSLEGIYKVLFDTIAEGLLIVNSEGNIVMANPSACEMFLCEQDHIIGVKVEELVPMPSRKKHVKLREEYQKDPHARQMGQNINLQAVRRDGSHFDVEISLNHFRSEGELFILAMLTDITERIEQEKHIRHLNATLEEKVEERTKQVLESQKLYSAIARNFPNGTINVFDRDLRYIFVEGLELQELGVSKDKLIGTCYLDRISQEIRPTIEKELAEVFHGQSKLFELQHQGETYKINAVPLSDDKHSIDKILVVEENISLQKEIEVQREAALQKEKQLNELKSRFVSMASHEFRTPLSTVLSSVSLIEKYIERGQTDKTEKHIKRVKGAVASLTEILNDFLSVEKLESNKDVVKKVHFNFCDFVEDMVEEMRTICKKGQKIKLDIIGDCTDIEADPKILKNVLYNLISNAIKYSGEGQTIYFTNKISDSELKIEVRDEGIGIPDEDQQDLFGRFFRAKNVINIKGTGLGLNIVKKYIEALGGSISFKSKLNEGSTFIVEIPL